MNGREVSSKEEVKGIIGKDKLIKLAKWRKLFMLVVDTWATAVESREGERDPASCRCLVPQQPWP